MAKRNAVIAVQLEVHCPYCGDPHPNAANGGSHLWLPSEVAASEGQRVCDACDKPFQLITRTSVRVEG